MKKDIPSNKWTLEDAKYAVEHSLKGDMNPIFTAYTYRDKQNKGTPLQITTPMNAIYRTMKLHKKINCNYTIYKTCNYTIYRKCNYTIYKKCNDTI